MVSYKIDDCREIIKSEVFEAEVEETFIVFVSIQVNVPPSMFCASVIAQPDIVAFFRKAVRG